MASRRVATIAWSKTRPTCDAEALQLPGLAGEGLHDAHAGDVLLGVRGELGDALLDLLDGGTGAVAIAVGDDHHERDGRERDQPQLGVERDHRGAGEQNHEDRLHDEHEPVAEEEAHGRQVHGGAGHQLPRLMVVEEAELEALEVAVEALAQVVLDAERDVSRDYAPPVHERPPGEHDGDDPCGEQRERVAVVDGGRGVGVANVCGGLVDRFHCVPHQARHQHGHHHREARERPGDDHAALVGTQEAE